jgi:hypothetical protein
MNTTSQVSVKIAVKSQKARVCRADVRVQSAFRV